MMFQPSQPQRTDFYSDGISVQVNAADAELHFLLSPPGGMGDQQHQVTVRVSLIQAKVIAIMLKKAIQQYEAENGKVSIPAKMAEALQISLHDDWI